MTQKIAITGAASQTGRAILELIEERNIVPSALFALESGAQPGAEISYGEDKVLALHKIENFDFGAVDIIVNAAGPAGAKDLAATGKTLIDVSSAFRMDPNVPLIAAGVNETLISKDKKILATPNCMVSGIVAALKPLHDKAKITRIHAATYQSVSGQGKPAMDELFNQTRKIYVADPIEPQEFPKQIAFNILPQIGKFLDDRSTSEEFSIKSETKKILGKDIAVTVTAVRVPVFIGHCAALHIECDQELSAIEARDLLRRSKGITVIDVENEDLEYITPHEVQGELDVYVSRIREDSASDTGLCLWVALDNIQRGQAFNVIRILENLL